MSQFMPSLCSLLFVFVGFGFGQIPGPENIIPDAAKKALLKATDCTLVSLEPKDGDVEGGLYGWRVLGETAIKDSMQCRTVLASVEQSVAAPGEWGAKCFDPRHALRVKYEGHTLDFVICFECRWIYIFGDGKKLEDVALNDKAKAEFQPVLDKILTAAKVHLAEKSRFSQE
jgi:hypothetical protein